VRGTLPEEELRTYRLCKLLGCLPSQLEEEPGVMLDWILAIDDTITETKNSMWEREN